MANFIKCEWCGGEMTLSADGVTAECEYCGRRTIWKEPKGEALVLEMNRANSYRRANRFSDAIMSYRLITEKNPKDAEAWWGLVLSMYGIEYVKDPRGGYVPTCHRTVREEIFENGDYKKAYAFAAEGQKGEYEEEAKEIDRLQKEILRLADAGEDYDVFISFKSKDRAGRMTRDARVARIIYDELVKRGIRTFFSDVTLKGKMFSDYEPVIYRALMSCKYFILVGTSDEYIRSEWVTNEWSRFEERMEREKLSGVACAVFDGGAVKELPEFLRAQGADLRDYPAGGYEIHVADAVEAKMGRKKRSREEEEILKRIEEQKKAQRELEEQLKGMRSSGGNAQTRGASATVDSLLLRAEQELESGNYGEANSYYNRVLDADPQNAEAWWGLFLAGREISHEVNVYTQVNDVEYLNEIPKDRYYVNAKKYALGEFKKRIKNFVQELKKQTETKIESLKISLVGIEEQLHNEIEKQNAAEAHRIKTTNENNQKISELTTNIEKLCIDRGTQWNITKKCEKKSKQNVFAGFPYFDDFNANLGMWAMFFWALLPYFFIYVIFIIPIFIFVKNSNRKKYVLENNKLRDLDKKLSELQNKKGLYEKTNEQLKNEDYGREVKILENKRKENIWYSSQYAIFYEDIDGGKG